MFIESDNIDTISKKLQKVFGIHGIVIAYKVNTNTEEIQKQLIKVFLSNQWILTT